MNLPKQITGFWKKFFTFPKSRLIDSSASTSAFSTFQNTIGYTFRNQSLLEQALTHKSSVQPEDKLGLLSNERLEFLGDSVLNCLVTEHLYAVYPDSPEGQLSKIKSLIVSRKILGEIAQSFSMGEYLLLGHSEKKSGGSQRVSLMSNAFEAVLGAMYLDGGLDCARTFLSKFLFDNINDIVKDSDNINYKSHILELSQRDGFGVPSYRVVSATGPEHAKEFTMEISIAHTVLGEGSGANKKIAEQNAARAALLIYSKESLLIQHKGVPENELVSH